jgi:hypothetical protein
MSRIAIQLLTLATYATALVVVPVVTPAEAATNSSKHLKKHKSQKSSAFSGPWPAGQAWPVSRHSSRAGDVCPGNARGIDCRVWPPPIEDDPDRKASGTDGG